MVTFTTAPVSRIREQPRQRAMSASLQEQRAPTPLPRHLVSRSQDDAGDLWTLGTPTPSANGQILVVVFVLTQKNT